MGLGNLFKNQTKSQTKGLLRKCPWYMQGLHFPFADGSFMKRTPRRPTVWPYVLIAFCLLCFKFLFLQGPEGGGSDGPPLAALPAVSPETRPLAAQMAYVREALAAHRFEEALDLAEQMQARVMQDPALEPAWVARFLEAKGDIHAYLWQHADALACWNQAVPRTAPDHRARLERKIRRGGEVLEKYNDERHLQAVYQAMPGTGPARALQGKVAVIYLFVQMKGTGGWGLKAREVALRSWSSARTWLVHWADLYRQTVTFSERLYIIDNSPVLGRLAIDGAAFNAQIGPIVRQAVTELNGGSPQAFMDRIKAEERADQVILLLHVDARRRSFAHCCIGGCDGYYGEFAFIFEPPSPRRWQALEYALAHEALHLFGADDLYDISTAKYYQPRDIMNYPSRFLSGSTLEGISAWAVGLLDTRPDTPFPVKEN